MTSLVSIIMPAFNAGPWIEESLRSATAQTHPLIEILVIDDGSTDDTLARARRFAAHTARDVQVHTQPNAGAAAARNHGLRLARGEFIQFLDADDLLAPDKIACQFGPLLAAGPDALASGTWGRFHDAPADTFWPDETVARATTGVEFLQLHYETNTMMQPGAWLAPRALLDRVGPWDETLSLNDDGEYFARVMLAASRLVPVPAARCHYRSAGPGSLSRRRDARALASLHRSVELTVAHLLAADRSPRTLAAVNLGWRRTAFDLYPDATPLARRARQAAAATGGPDTPIGGPGWVQQVARLTGWSFARRLQLLRASLR